ncbi:MAG: NADH-quinone oxidoreductase subunit NuoG [Acidimicrobiales bacterium]
MADPTVTSHHAIAPSSTDGATVNITLDGREIPVAAGRFLIAAAEDAGVFIPRFCYHPRMKPVGMCRMCLVEVSGPRGATLQPACYLSVSDGMVVDTTSEKVRKAQDGVLEFLLVNHPLDCPVCDKGGECPLQDQTLAYGPGESRFIEEKRHFAKPIALSPLVLLDRERCIQCGRCTRFAAEIAGEPMIDFAGRGDALEVAIADGHVFSSAFSGNTVQICPVGALTSTPYRFTARPWDLDQVESTCTTCAVGCRAAVQSSSNRVTRLLGMDSDPVNQSWLCDKGRYAYEALNSENRLTEPLVRSAGGVLEPSGWSEALSVAAGRLAAVKKAHGADAIGVIGGARLTNEDAYAWAKLAKGVIGTDSVDAQLGDGLPAELVLGLPRATIDEACSAKCVIVIAGDLYEELPVLYLRLRVAAEDSGLPIIEMTPRSTHLSSGTASATLITAPGAAGTMAAALVARNRPADVPQEGWDAAVAALSSIGEDGSGLVVVVGRGSVAENAEVVSEAAGTLADAFPSARFLPALRRGNVMGALDMGLAPGLLPGRVSLESAREWYASEEGWSALAPESGYERGRDTAGVLEGLADGSMKAVVLVGADPIGDFPDAELATDALSKADLVIAVDCFRSPSVERAHVVLTAATHHERTGTTTNIEGRVIRVGQKLTPPVMCWPDWMIAVELAARLGSDLGVGSATELWDEIARLAPSHSGLTRAVLDSPGARDGVVVPMKATPVSIGRGQGAKGTGPFDPIATPGIESVELQGPISRVGAAEQSGGSNGSLEQRGADEDGRSAKPALIRPAKPALIERDIAFREDLVVAEPPSRTLRLVAPRRLYDHGVQVSESPALAGLVGPLVAKVNPAELEARQISPGATVRLTADSPGRGAIEIEVVGDPGVPVGVIDVSANVRANRAESTGPEAVATISGLIRSSNIVVDLRMENP